MKRAFITGITGQDGSYLAEILLGRGYEVHGMVRRSSSFNTGRIDHIFNNLHLHHGDMLDGARLAALIQKIRPHEIYNLAAQSHVKVSEEQPEYTNDVDYMGVVRLIEAIKSLGSDAESVRMLQASSSEMFGNQPSPQGLHTRFAPVSPYAVAKTAAHYACKNARESGLHISCAISFNHESPRRGETFVTRKITRWLACDLRLHLHPLTGDPARDPLILGNTAAERDWGYAYEYADAFARILQMNHPNDYVLCTGEAHSVQEFIDVAFGLVGMDANLYISHDDKYERANDVNRLCGVPSESCRSIGWKAETRFEELVRLMLVADMKSEGLNPKNYIKETTE